MIALPSTGNVLACAAPAPPLNRRLLRVGIFSQEGTLTFQLGKDDSRVGDRKSSFGDVEGGYVWPTCEGVGVRLPWLWARSPVGEAVIRESGGRGGVSEVGEAVMGMNEELSLFCTYVKSSLASKFS